MNLSKKLSVTVFVVFLIMVLSATSFHPSQAQGSNIHYVKHDAVGADDGTSWEDAFVDLQDALAAAGAGDEIWVAAGIYYPAPEPEQGESPDRSATFLLKNEVAVYGGFSGNETSRGERDWEVNVTILSGDLERNDITENGVVTNPDCIVGDNAFHVVSARGAGTAVYLLEGFIITGGDADPPAEGHSFNGYGAGINFIAGSDPHTTNSLVISSVHMIGNRAKYMGGGLYLEWVAVHLTIKDVTFSNNHAHAGAGMYFKKSNRNARNILLEDVIFQGNAADDRAGGLYLESRDDDNIKLSKVSFIENQALDQYGGGLLSWSTVNPIQLKDVTFENNQAFFGGGMSNLYGHAELQDVVFKGNTAITTDSGAFGQGGGLYHTGLQSMGNGNLVLTNTVFAGNTAKDGGGIYINTDGDDTLKLVNVFLGGNESSGDGGGIHSNLRYLDMINVTMSGNKAEGSVLGSRGGCFYNFNQNTAAGPTLINCIIWGNHADNNPQIHNHSSGKSPVISYSLIQGSGGSGQDWNAALGEDDGENLDEDPLFVNPVEASIAPTMSGDYRLQFESPAVDTGSNQPFTAGGAAHGVTKDLDGNPRIVGGQVDMGAYELDYEGIETGSLTVTLEPEEARDQGAAWSIDGGSTWNVSGTTLNLDPGDYVVTFNEMEGFSAPPEVDIIISRGMSTSLEGVYREAVLFVKCDAADSGDGSSWENAYTCLQEALDNSREGMEIWVTAGIYTPPLPSEGDIRTATFHLTDGVAVYGGFNGTETSRGNRNWETSITVLSGDLYGDDTTGADGIVEDPVDDIEGDNAYTVVTAVEAGESTILDGFIITAGKSDGELSDPFEQVFGGGMYIENASPTLQNLIITGCYGGGIYNNTSHSSLSDVVIKSNHGIGMRNDYSSPSLTRVLFEANVGSDQNSSGGGMLNLFSYPILNQVDFISNGDWWSKSPGYGGGMANSNSNPTLVNVTFRGNYAYYEGGGMRNESSSPTLINVLFSGNATDMRGGGMYNSGSTNQPDLTNVTFSRNYSGQYGGAMFNRGNSSPILTNCIIWNNYAPEITSTEIWNHEAVPQFSYSIIRGSGGSSDWNTYFGTDEGNNIDIDPMFVQEGTGFSSSGSTAGNFRLQALSPAIDAGNNDVLTVLVDLDNNPRISGSAVDIGPYEYQFTAGGIAVVANAGELAAAVENPNISVIGFNNNITADIDANRLISVDFSTYTLNGSMSVTSAEVGALVFSGTGTQSITGDLTVDVPNATVTNNIKVGGTITIKDVAGNTWEENADGNHLIIDMQDHEKTIIINGHIQMLTVLNSGDDLNIIINGTVQTAVFYAAADVTGAGNIESVHIASEGVELDEEPQQYVYFLVLQVNPENRGTVEGAGFYAEGDAALIKAQASSGYRFVNWTFPEGVSADESSAETTLIMPAANVEVTANFTRLVSSSGASGVVRQPETTLTVKAEGEGSVSPEIGVHTYRRGTVVELKAVPDEGWVFKNWIGDAADAESASTEITMDKDQEVTAVFLEDIVEKPVPSVKISLSIGSKKVLVNDEEFLMDVAPFINIEAGRTMIPLRFVSEWLGAEVHWLQSTRQVVIVHEDKTITLTIDSDTSLVNDEEVLIDCPAVILESRTVVPLRFVSEIMDAAVHWESETQVITILMENHSII